MWKCLYQVFNNRGKLMKRMLLTCAAVAMLAQFSVAQTAVLQTAKPVISQVKEGTHLFRQGELGRINKASVRLNTKAKPGKTVKDAPTTFTSNLLTLSDPAYSYNDSGLRGISAGQRFDAASIFPENLMKRFAGNTIGTFQTMLPAGISEVELWIADYNTMRTIWSTTLSNPQEGLVSAPCNLQITGDAILMGFTYTITSSTLVTEQGVTSLPIVVTPTYQPQGLLMGVGDGSLQDYSAQVYEDLYGAYYFNALTEGGAGLKENDLQMGAINNQRSEIGAQLPVNGNLLTWGTKPLMTAEISTTVNGTTQNNVISTGITEETASQTSTYGATVSFELQQPITAPSTPSRYEITASVNSVNGAADGFDGDNDNVCTGVGIALDNHFARKVVVEELTGLWCGWCPRGMVAMENLKTLYPEDVVTIAVHADDALQADSYLDLAYWSGSFPSAFVSRVYLADPYYGATSSATMGITDLVDEVLASPAEAQIGVESALSADGQSINVTSFTKFCMADPSETAHYGVAYALVEDGVRGLSYSQTNYYSSSLSGGPYQGETAASSGLPEDLAAFVEQGPSLTGLTYNDVARGIYDCFGLEGSLTGNISNGDLQTHTYSIPLPQTVLNTDNLRLVAMVVDLQTLEVVNAVQVPVGESNTTGIGAVTEPAKAEITAENGAVSVSTEGGATGVAKVYSTDGKLVAQATVNGSATLSVGGQKGTYIVRVECGKDITVKKVAL